MLGEYVKTVDLETVMVGSHSMRNVWANAQ